ncbi:hypothetical protein MG293_009753 [Ovis ammon polii]|uniref:Uncharacterized protein n=1 Tax=Ovis ammon polii TaxID=230172 RepID=A0AAD4U9Q7_OVIAM|nr:hypothetical protein MG293_009753 [Ovis ammon polii]KAI4568382.1 hypothetical protein MJT46_008180 [Ovis ammon polii x Ovis aries]
MFGSLDDAVCLVPKAKADEWLGRDWLKPAYHGEGTIKSRPQAPALQPFVHLSDSAPFSEQRRISTFNATSIPGHPDPMGTPFGERLTDSGSLGQKALPERMPGRRSVHE